MMEALKQAMLAGEEGEVPVGAVVVSQGKIIARAYNQCEKLNDATAHAEMQAITSASYELQSKYLDDCDLYVSLEPCPMCAAALYWTRIQNLYFAASDPKRGYTLIKNSLLHPQTQVFKGLLRQESESLLKEFFNNLRK
jgi:tRNA(adenine34) deaminase